MINASLIALGMVPHEGTDAQLVTADDLRKLAHIWRSIADERRRSLGLCDDTVAKALDHCASGIDLMLATESNGQ